MDFNKIYKELKLEENFSKLQKLELYTLIRHHIQDKEYEDDFINELYEFYLYVKSEFYEDDYSLDDFIDYLYETTIKLKIDICDIDLDECANEYESWRDKEWNSE